MGALRAAHACIAFQCECPRTGPFYLLSRNLFHILFSLCAVRTNRLVGRLAVTYIDQSLFTGVNGSLRFPL